MGGPFGKTFDTEWQGIAIPVSTRVATPCSHKIVAFLSLSAFLDTQRTRPLLVPFHTSILALGVTRNCVFLDSVDDVFPWDE